jgi:hypothetical protein
MSKITFIAFLYVIGVGGTGLGLVDLYFSARNAIQYARAESGVMTTTDPAVGRMAKYSPGDGTYADVVYTTAKRTVQVRHAWLNRDMVRRAADGVPIPVKFVGDHPRGGYYDGEQPEWKFGGLIVGVIFLVVAIFAHRLLRKESGVA